MSKLLSKEDIQTAINESTTLTDLAIKLGYKNPQSVARTLKRLILGYNLDVSHFTSYSTLEFDKNKISNPRLTLSKRKKIIESANNSCEICGVCEHLGLQVILELHHLDGDKHNNSLENIQVLCLNCHSQTPNWRGRTKSLVRHEPVNPREPRPIKKECLDCGQLICNQSIRCLSCRGNSKRKFEVTKEELEKLIQEIPMTKIGEMFGVSDNAIRRRAKKLGIILENRRGYWT